MLQLSSNCEVLMFTCCFVEDYTELFKTVYCLHRTLIFPHFTN